jgi:hypothetical protein
MSDQFGVPPTPLMSAVKARNLARSYKAFADHIAEQGDAAGARHAERQSQWWMAYAIALSQIPPGATDESTAP